jgi:beta-1,4-mannosyl-glycoprotein beta-1,4-N-acetylglucosaminyltransferase
MIFDCEEWMLEIKLNELGDVVDMFIIVEGAFTLQNSPREQCFPRINQSNGQISKWSDKIVYVYDERLITGFSYWEAEVHYRNSIGVLGMERLSAHDEDLVIVTDLDEMIHSSFLWVLKWYDGFATSINVQVLWTYYSYKWVNPNTFFLNAIVSVKELRSVGNRTNEVRLTLAGKGWSTGKDMLVGWHCSWCMPTARFVDKIAHFAHSEMNQERYKNVVWLDQLREQGLWFPDSAPNGCIQSKMQIPAYVERNKDKFRAIL